MELISLILNKRVEVEWYTQIKGYSVKAIWKTYQSRIVNNMLKLKSGDCEITIPVPYFEKAAYQNKYDLIIGELCITEQENVKITYLFKKKIAR